jgi:hypothetical protein
LQVLFWTPAAESYINYYRSQSSLSRERKCEGTSLPGVGGGALPPAAGAINNQQVDLRFIEM